MSFNPNQFEQTRPVGELDLQTNPNPSVMTVRIDPASEATFVPGQGVKFVDKGASDPGGVPIVGARSGNTDQLDGIIVFSTKKAVFVANDLVQIAGNGAVMVLLAGATLARGVDVTLDNSNAGEFLAVTTATKAGTLIDKVADGDQGRIRLQFVEAST